MIKMCVCVCVCVYIGILHSHKKWNFAIYKIGGSRGYNTKWNKSEKDKYFVILMWGILKINQMNENNK